MVLISPTKLAATRIAIREVFKRNPKKFGLMLFFGFLAGLFGGIGVGAVLPLFSLITPQTSEGANVVTNAVRSIFDFFNIPFTLTYLVMFIALLFVLKALIQMITKYLNIKTMAEYEERVRRDLFAKTFKSTWPYLLGQKSGYLERILVADISNASSIILQVNGLILLLTGLIMYLIVALSISTSITALTLGLGALLFLILRPILYRTRNISKKMSETEKTATHYIGETLAGSKIIKASGLEKNVIEKSRHYFSLLRDIRTKTAFYHYTTGHIFEPIGFIFISLIFVFYQNNPGFNVIAFAAVVYLVEKIFMYMQSLLGTVQQINEMIPYLRSVIRFRKLTRKNEEVEQGRSAFQFNKSLVFKNVSFSYSSGRPVLSNISFSISKGEMIGIMGPSGGGKTTIVDLILRLFNPASGQIVIDDKNAAEIRVKRWRENIRYVPQDVFLLNDTIENNIQFFGEKLTHEKIVEAAKMANIYSLIRSLPDGFQTIIGERGVKLSGGERQRIALARAMVRVPQILILDEVTSSLDHRSELLIQESIRNLKGRVTIIIIAHRLSTILNSDKVLVLDQGKIAEYDSPRELIKNTDSHLYQIYGIQQDV